MTSRHRQPFASAVVILCAAVSCTIRVDSATTSTASLHTASHVNVVMTTSKSTSSSTSTLPSRSSTDDLTSGQRVGLATLLSLLTSTNELRSTSVSNSTVTSSGSPPAVSSHTARSQALVFGPTSDSKTDPPRTTVTSFPTLAALNPTTMSPPMMSGVSSTRRAVSSTHLQTVSRSVTSSPNDVITLSSTLALENRTSPVLETTSRSTTRTSWSTAAVKFSTEYSPNQTAYLELVSNLTGPYQQVTVSEAISNRSRVTTSTGRSQDGMFSVTSATTRLSTRGRSMTSPLSYADNSTLHLNFTDLPSHVMTSQMARDAAMTSETQVTVVTDPATNITTAIETDTLPLIVGLAVGLGLGVILLCVVFVAVTLLAHKRRQRRHSDRQKLSSSSRNYDRVSYPSQQSPSSPDHQHPQQQQAKIRAGRRHNRLPSSKEVFNVEVQTSTDNDAAGSSTPPAQSSTDQTVVDVSPTPKKSASKPIPSGGKRANGGNRSAKNQDKPNVVRRLRGKPSQLQKPYFVVDEDNNAAMSSDQKAAASDPFWEPFEEEKSSRPLSAGPQQTRDTFKPAANSSSENSASPSTEPDMQMCYVLLPTGDIGQSSTDTQRSVLL